MKFRFSGAILEGKKIGYVTNKNEFDAFITQNKIEIEDILTDHLEEQEIYQWDELDIECKVSSQINDELKCIVLLGKDFIHEEAFEGDQLVRTVKGAIFCIGDAELT